MKIAVLSDIHGNMDALAAVMDDVKAEGCEKIFILGDYAMAGPEPEKIIDGFISMKDSENMTLIQGNTDLMLAEYSEDLYTQLKSKAPVMAEALKYDAALLDEKRTKFLKLLPAQYELDIEGVKILLVHGSPRRNNEDILPDTPMEEVEKMLEGVSANLVLCGHTHIPCGFQLKNKQTVVNVGSVGRPFTEKPDACYLKLTVENGKCLFEHKFIKYNNGQAASKLAKQSFEGSDKLAEMLLNPTVRHF